MEKRSKEKEKEMEPGIALGVSEQPTGADLAFAEEFHYLPPLVQRYAGQFVPVTGKIYLPSRGMSYGNKLPNGVIEMVPMKTTEEKILAGAGEDTNKILDLLFDRLFLTKTLHPKEMLATDRFFCLLMIRSNAYGPDYAFKVKCPECGLQFEHVVLLPFPGEPTIQEIMEADGVQEYLDLISYPEDTFTSYEDLSGRINWPGTFKMKYMKTNFSEPFPRVLPVCQKAVGLRLLRGKDEDLIEKHTEKRYAKRQPGELGDPGYTFRMSLHIVSIDGKDVTGPRFLGERMAFVENLMAMDSASLKQGIEEWESGIETTIDIKCRRPGCGWIFQKELPFTRDFFRPRRDRAGKS